MRHLLCLVALFLAGCEHDSFLIEITPLEDGFRRELTAWHVKPSGASPPGADDDSQNTIGPVNEEQLLSLTEIYGPGQPIEDGKKHRFSGIFADCPPCDIGGYGSFTRHDSPLGSLTVYCERFRGSADLEGELSQRRQAADRLVDLLAGWLRSEMKDEPEWTAIEAFLDERFRQDLKNLAVYAWSSNVAEQFQADSQVEFAFRSWQHLCERNYFRPAELPQLVGGWQAQEDPRVVLRVIQRALARQIGISDDQPLPASLAWLGDPQQVRQSLDCYLRQSDFYQTQLAEWRAQHPDDAEREAPDPSDLLVDLILRQVLGLRFLGSSDQVEVHLHSGQQPIHTNGEWDADTARVIWKLDLAPNRSLPAFSYAAWCDPETEFQTVHFGRVLLDGEQLGQYVLWHYGLSADQAEVWNRFLQECRPGEQLRSRIRSFRFADPESQQPPEDKADPAETPRGLLLKALGEE